MKKNNKEKTNKSKSKQHTLTDLIKGLTILQVIVGVSCLLLLSSSSVYYLHRINQDPDTQISEEQVGSDLRVNNADFKKIEENKNETPGGSIGNTTQSQTQTSPSTSINNSANEEWLRRHEETMRQMAIENAKRQKCDDDNSAAARKYSAAIDRARAAYNEVMDQWESVKDLPYYQRHPYEQYAADAKSKHNAISVPAYKEYSGTVSSLKLQGCQIIQLYPDYSW